MSNETEVERLIQQLSSDNWRFAIDGLVKIGEPAVIPLITTLKEGEESARWWAAEALGKIGDSRAVMPLIDALTDNNWGLHRKAAWALGEIGDKRAVMPLIDTLEYGDEDARENAAEALGKIGKPAVLPLVDALKNGGGGRKTAEALENIGEPAIPLLYDAAEKYPEIREELLRIAGEIVAKSTRGSGCIGTPEEHRGIRSAVAGLALGNGAKPGRVRV